MKGTTIIYLLLAVLGATAAVLVPLEMYRSGSTALPAWRGAVLPGPLSAAHAFLDTKCESCHTPNRGVEAASCVTCHSTAAPELLTKPSTAFHANIGECAGCHVEHQGRDRRPLNMDHQCWPLWGMPEPPKPRRATRRRRVKPASVTQWRSCRPCYLAAGRTWLAALLIADPYHPAQRRPSTARVATSTGIRMGRCSAGTARAVTIRRLGRSPPSGARRPVRRTVCSATRPRLATT